MAVYFDRREQQWKTVPDCEVAGLRWNAETQRCEQCTECGLLGLTLLAFLIWLLKS